jgi:hypothetical protein
MISETTELFSELTGLNIRADFITFRRSGTCTSCTKDLILNCYWEEIRKQYNN